ncbi:amidohydrolase [Treponema phagedenis]|uniref:Amidohydrolase n=1 Tax=Treponema phagedenis TaxID=162 RepID=A0A0B7GQX8_TREPH|nr:M20 family metallopeptidase [Treponema phagedenis]NVP24526.1 amidohydrolase [Treponema phagedenis]QEJ94779.1 amidohydrolase [Treponema phagedenis]QEJ97715.1 amidohydrolase [Treponema phagedenis]QEK00685.1 amidohydrolase [Treponema phagedenis]QEK03282.1 amidohydrolase [Treponema phagedenis]
MDFLKRAKEIEDEIIHNRRELHKIPELELNLPKTVQYVCAQLHEMDIKHRLLVNGNAIVAEVGGKNSGKCIAIRADMDALPILEETGLPFASTHSGKMHACGHDGHTAMALGAAKLLKEKENELKGYVKFFFQPGEEIPGGAKPMIDEGCMENPKVDAVVGLHEGAVFGNFPTGTIAYKKGAMMASMDRFKITVKGRGGHGARPTDFIDPIATISEINMGIQKIISREIDPTTAALISVCQIHGGTSQNIIPETVWEEGTVRTLDEKTRDFVEKRLTEISQNIARAYNAEAEVLYERFYPVVVNDFAFTEFAKNIAIDLFGEEKVLELPVPTMGGEDIAFFLQKAPGTYFGLNNLKKDKTGVAHPHHSSKFDVEENTFYLGTALLAAVAYRFLSEEEV